MQLTTQTVAPYKGGQIEIQNAGEGYLYRGEVADIDIIDNELRVKLAWLAKGAGSPLLSRWVKDDPRDYAASLEIYSASNIGPSGDETGGSDRICLNSAIIGEVVVLFPPDGSKLDPAKVEGLELTQKPAPAPKKKFHEVVSQLLAVAPVGINSDFASAKAAEVATLLTVLQESDMKPDHAHEIAKLHGRLPELLRSAGQNTLADMAAETLEDLNGRQDEPKKH